MKFFYAILNIIIFSFTCLHAEESLFVAGTNSVFVISPHVPKVKPFAILQNFQPSLLAATRDGSALYTASFNQLAKINTSTYETSAIYPVGNRPSHIAISLSGERVATTNQMDNTVSLIDTKKDDIATIAVGSHPTSSIFTQDDHYLIVCNQFSNNLNVIRLEQPITDSVLAFSISLPDGFRPKSIRSVDKTIKESRRKRKNHHFEKSRNIETFKILGQKSLITLLLDADKGTYALRDEVPFDDSSSMQDGDIDKDTTYIATDHEVLTVDGDRILQRLELNNQDQRAFYLTKAFGNLIISQANNSEGKISFYNKENVEVGSVPASKVTALSRGSSSFDLRTFLQKGKKGLHLYATNAANHSIDIIDIKTISIVDSVDLGETPISILLINTSTPAARVAIDTQRYRAVTTQSGTSAGFDTSENDYSYKKQQISPMQPAGAG